MKCDLVLNGEKYLRMDQMKFVEDSLYQVYVGDTILHTELKKRMNTELEKIEQIVLFLKKELTFPVKACASSSFFHVT